MEESASDRYRRGLPMETLLQVCGVPVDTDGMTPEWLEDLRLAATFIEKAHATRSGLEQPLTLLVSLLAQLPKYQPTHLPFGYEGQIVKSENWMHRDDLEHVGKQLVGLTWRGVEPASVPLYISDAVDQALEVGFLEPKQYDAWRPGMESGSGWRTAVKCTPYGMTMAQAVTGITRQSLLVKNSASPTAGPMRRPPKRLAINATGSKAGLASASADAAEADGPNTAVDDTREAIHGAKPSPSVITPRTIDLEQQPPNVELGKAGEPCHVLGVEKRPLTRRSRNQTGYLVHAALRRWARPGGVDERPCVRSLNGMPTGFSARFRVSTAS